MAIIGTHMIFYTSEAEALRAQLRDAFGFESVDAGQGWLIFALPPAELGVHPAEGPTYDSGTRHQISFMCDDIHSTVSDLRGKGIQIDGDFQEQRYGILANMTLAGGLKAILYEPRHPTALGLK